MDTARTPETGFVPRLLPAAATALALGVGLALLWNGAGRSSATYDEVAYLRIAAHWWRTGEQESIGRMGSPLTFWKLQQAPVLWWLDHSGRATWIDDPIRHQADLLPAVRRGGLWLWGLGLLITAGWARRLYGPWSMALASWLFALGPNILANAGLATMEMPLVAASAATFSLFDAFLKSGRRILFGASAIACGLAFSLKFTAIAFSPLLAVAWSIEQLRRGEPRAVVWKKVLPGMAVFVGLLVVTNLLMTGFATITPSESRGSHPALEGHVPAALVALVEAPWPQDWVAFAVQLRHQRSGGPSYLLGERAQRGWWHYYFIALAVKLPLGVWLLLVVRGLSGSRVDPDGRGRFAFAVVFGFLAITALGSTRNYGVRYLLPMAPAAIVWMSALANRRWPERWIAVAGLASVAWATTSIHPHELTYFNALAGGSNGGRWILADSNLDWGQGMRSLAKLQAERPELRELTIYAFGDTDPLHYGVVGTRHLIDAGTVHPGLPARLLASTPFLAVSTSLTWGPWGPSGYFDGLRVIEPDLWTDDRTIAIYRVSKLGQMLRPGG